MRQHQGAEAISSARGLRAQQARTRQELRRFAPPGRSWAGSTRAPARAIGEPYPEAPSRPASQQPLLIQDAVAARAHTLILTGELDLHTAPQFEAVFAGLYGSSPREVVLDLTGLRFLDAAGLRAIAIADLECRLRGHELHILQAPPAVHEVFELTGLSELLPFRAVGTPRTALPAPRS